MSSTYIISLGLKDSGTSNSINSSTSVPPGVIDTSTSLSLVGTGAKGYGLAYAQNFALLLTNFASTTQEPDNPRNGQLWFKGSDKGLKLRVNGDWTTVYGSASHPGLEALSSFDTAAKIAALQSSVATITSYSPAVANQVLTVNSTGTGLTWSTVSTAFVKTNASSTPTVNEAFDIGSPTLKYNSIYAKSFNGTALEALYADVAERYEAEEFLEPGTVVEIGGAKEIRKTSTAFSSDVFGVISTDPAVKMNANAGDDTSHPYVALVGRVPVKVVGKVTKGDRLVSSNIPGVAMSVGTKIYGYEHVIGRSLLDKDTEDVGMVVVAVGSK